MDLNHEFTVHKPIDEAWVVLTDVEKIAPCLPGAQLQEIAHEDGIEKYRGIVKVKLGAIQSQFKGEAHFIEKDDENHKAVLKAAGRDTGGRGNAAATITAILEPVSESVTTCKVLTDLSITGKVANFGRGVLADVSDKLLAQFSDNLNTLLDQDAPADTAPAEAEAPAADATESAEATAAEATATTAATDETPAAEAATETPAPPKVRTIDGPAAEPIDLLEHAGAPVLKILVPLLGGLAILFFLLRRRKS
jgi:carbon monoxide dehydrogenase subunit G